MSNTGAQKAGLNSVSPLRATISPVTEGRFPAKLAGRGDYGRLPAGVRMAARPILGSRRAGRGACRSAEIAGAAATVAFGAIVFSAPFANAQTTPVPESVLITARPAD